MRQPGGTTTTTTTIGKSASYGKSQAKLPKIEDEGYLDVWEQIAEED